jgi:hypothetical protein
VEVLVPEIVWCENPLVLEPCAGDGAIVDVLNHMVCGHILASDINLDCRYGNGEDFITSPDHQRYDFIVTNPPFSLAKEFIDRALEVANCVIMLLPQSFFGSQSRKEWWKSHPPTAQFILSKRPSFTGNGKTDSEVYSWVVWDTTGRQKVGWHWL